MEGDKDVDELDEKLCMAFDAEEDIVSASWLVWLWLAGGVAIERERSPPCEYRMGLGSWGGMTGNLEEGTPGQVVRYTVGRVTGIKVIGRMKGVSSGGRNGIVGNGFSPGSSDGIHIHKSVYGVM